MTHQIMNDFVEIAIQWNTGYNLQRANRNLLRIYINDLQINISGIKLNTAEISSNISHPRY